MACVVGGGAGRLGAALLSMAAEMSTKARGAGDVMKATWWLAYENWA